MAKVQESGHKSVSVQDLYESGFALRCSGDYQQARDVLGRVLESDPQHLEARWQLALIDGFEGEFERSLEGLKTLAEEAPANLEIRYDYAMTLMMLGFAEESCVEFRAILEINPEHEKAKQQIIYCE